MRISTLCFHQSLSMLRHIYKVILSFFKILNWTYHDDLSHLRWTVDELEDLEFVRQVIESIYPGNKNFRTKDIFRPSLPTARNLLRSMPIFTRK